MKVKFASFYSSKPFDILCIMLFQPDLHDLVVFDHFKYKVRKSIERMIFSALCYSNQICMV